MRTLLSRVARVPAWAWLVLVLLVVWGITATMAYRSGRDAERSSQREQLIVRERVIIDSIDRVRSSVGDSVIAALRASLAGAATLPAIDSSVARRRRVITIVDTNRVLVHDTTSGTSIEQFVHAGIVERIQGDSITIEQLRAQTRRDSSTIALTRLQLRADTLAIESRDRMIATLSIPCPKPPLIDRAIARVAVPVVKVALVGGAAYGVYRLVRSQLASR